MFLILNNNKKYVNKMHTIKKNCKSFPEYRTLPGETWTPVLWL